MENANLQTIGADIIVALNALGSVVKLYDSNNTAVVRQIDALYEALQRGFSQGANTIRLTLRSDEFFVNGDLMKVDIQLYMRARDVGSTLEKFNWNDVTFSSSLGKEDIKAFVNDLAQCIRKEASAMSSEQYGGISGKKSAGSAAAAFRFDPNKMAIWLMAGLLDVVDRLYVLSDKGERPSLLPIRRSLQMIVDNMKSFSGIYQMLSAFRDPKKKRSRAQTHVAIAIDVIGLCAYLQRSNVEMLEMAIAAILSGVSSDEDALKVIEPILEFDGLGESAFGMLLLLHDSAAALQGKAASIQGLVLASVIKYHKAINKDLSVPLPQVILDVIEGSEGQIKSLMQVFARYKGPFPIGSFIRVDDEVVLVVGQAARRTGKQRPMVARLSGKQILEVLDLSTAPQKTIQSLQSLSGYEHRLEDLELG